jgi:hypothetical protein
MSARPGDISSDIAPVPAASRGNEAKLGGEHILGGIS